MATPVNVASKATHAAAAVGDSDRVPHRVASPWDSVVALRARGRSMTEASACGQPTRAVQPTHLCSSGRRHNVRITFRDDHGEVDVQGHHGR